MHDPVNIDARRDDVVGVDGTGRDQFLDLDDCNLAGGRHHRIEIAGGLAIDEITFGIGLPGMDGLSIIKRWRANNRHMPVIMLTARGSWAERVEGIDAGADDYLPKPFQFEELVARVRALIRRSVGIGSAVIEVGGMRIDPRAMRVSVAGIPQSLTPLEYRLVSYLGHHRGRVVPASELQNHLYGDDFSRDANAMEVLITRLRKKLGPDCIGTRRGFGYHIGREEP